MSMAQRLALVDRNEPQVPVSKQCRLLKVARSRLYYQPASPSDEDLGLLRRLDELYLETPFYGSRRMMAQLRRE